MTAWFDSANIICEIAFDTDPWATTPTWTDISTYVRTPITVERGKQDEFSDFPPGVMSVTVDNGDRRFDPEYSSGPYFGKLLLMKRIRLRTTGVVTATVFDGFVSGYGQQWAFRDGTATITAIDGSRFLANSPLTLSPYELEVLADSPIHYWQLQGLSDVDDVVGSLDLGSSQAGELAASTVDLGVPLGLPAGVFSFAGEAGAVSAQPMAVEAWVKFDTPTNEEIFAIRADLATTPNEANLTLTGGSGTGITVGYYNPTANKNFFPSVIGFDAQSLKPGVHHLVAYADASNIYVLIDGQQVFSSALSTGSSSFGGDPITVVNSYTTGTRSGGISHVAVYSTAPSVARFQAHYLAGLLAFGHPAGEHGGERITRILDEIDFPSGQRNVKTGNTIVGAYLPAGGSALDAIRDVEIAEQGLAFFAKNGDFTFLDREHIWTQADSGVVFSDDGAVGAIEYAFADPDGTSIDWLRNIITVNYADGAGRVQRADAASRTASGPSEEPIDAPPVRNKTDGSNLALYVLRQRKDAALRFPALEVDLRPNLSTQMPAVLGLDIGSIVTVERTPMNVGSQIVKKCLVLGMNHEIVADQWTVTLYLIPAPTTATAAPYFQHAHATYGRLGTSAGNKIPY